jgi:hypothetical protein
MLFSFKQNKKKLIKDKNFKLDKKKSIKNVYWSASSSRHFLRFSSNIFKKQARNLCFTPLLFCMTHNEIYLRNKSYLKSTANFEMRTKVNKVYFIERGVILS